ncbi:hypothetical protein PIB30_101899 [Stylosanthes scabra]|uniref:Heat shock protein 70 n=1 Tax=Stylosanthes scabra TaxID=79078 RepID=A0ABU6QXM6_9FABA|nr:hypothetical protein [Stylosanthes scabra]
MVPTKKEKLFTTTIDNQQSIRFPIYEGQRLMASDNNLLGSFALEIPPTRPRGEPNITVCFEIDSNGILQVSAEEKATGMIKKVSVESNKGRLTREEVERMVKDAEKYKAEDEEHRKKAEARNNLANLAYNMRNVVEHEGIGSEISAQDKERINNAVDYALKWVDESDFATLDEINEEGKRLSSVFNSINLKMNHKISVSTTAGVISAVCSLLQLFSQ